MRRPVWLNWREQEAAETEPSGVTRPRTARAFLAAVRTVALSLSEVGAIGVWGGVRA